MGLKFRSEEDKAKLAFTQQDLDTIYLMNNPPEFGSDQVMPVQRSYGGRKRMHHQKAPLPMDFMIKQEEPSDLLMDDCGFDTNSLGPKTYAEDSLLPPDDLNLNSPFQPKEEPTSEIIEPQRGSIFSIQRFNRFQNLE